MADKKTGSRHPIAPEVTASDDREGVISRHPSFATVGFFAMHGSGGTDLFGANVRLANTIRMKVCRAHMETGTVDRVHEDETILELELSESQFTQAITQFNRGTGSPATLRQAMDIGVAPVVYPQIARVDVEERLKSRGDHRVEAEIKKIREAFEAVRSLAEADGSVSKKALQGAVKSLGYAIGNLPGNLDYYKKLLREDADRLLDEAKLELHASASLLATEGVPPLMLFDDRESSE
ncbi:hypothetical protein OIU34_21650 [Pararhizobium sp. BT-229]|uniref:hypothetical protein n=1 Tax=Pararhizobium sp. BT-229 TaxID=2986923 RepID=UPI0021F6A22A|nr:hypothetical protein [Pararhizobium sp. BT-229]MCV9964498.1 hypothetical protein [Pararhizobium sp. BT-229]